MHNGEFLKYVKHDEIDYVKWDRCVSEASNSRVYALSWFLDRTAGYWDALVWGDYDFVMPLPVKRKFGIFYLFHPIYCQQLGIFSSPPAEIGQKFYQRLEAKFIYGDIQLNAENTPPKNMKGISFFPRNNFLLQTTGADYRNVSSAYSENTRRNIVKASKNRLNYAEGIPQEDFLAFKMKNPAGKISKQNMQKLKSIIAYSVHKGFGEIIGVYSSENNLCAAAFFCRWKNRLIYMNAVSSDEGKELRAMFFLIDRLLKNAAGKNLILDFEGSMVPGIARFFKGFGATPEVYGQLRINRLPRAIKWAKGVTG